MKWTKVVKSEFLNKPNNLFKETDKISKKASENDIKYAVYVSVEDDSGKQIDYGYWSEDEESQLTNLEKAWLFDNVSEAESEIKSEIDILFKDSPYYIVFDIIKVRLTRRDEDGAVLTLTNRD